MSKFKYLYLWGYEEWRYADELQLIFADVFLREHEAIKDVLSQVKCLPVESINFTDLRRKNLISD